MQKDSKIYVSGGRTLIGAAIIRVLKRKGYQHVIGLPEEEFNLTDAVQVDNFFSKTQPEYVFIAAGKSGGIQANLKFPAELMLDNLLVECNVISSAFRHRVKKLLYLASSCIYPRNSPQPIKEENLLTGPLEPTNEAYAIAKIAGAKLCQAYRQQYGVNFIVGIPANAFGPSDDFSIENSHVIPALICKIHEAKTHNAHYVEIWGTGTPRREFIYADDLANACIFAMLNYDGPEPINLGGGTEISIGNLALIIKDVIGFPGELKYDTSRPDGMPIKALDSSKLAKMGWKATTSLQTALLETYKEFLQIQKSINVR